MRCPQVLALRLAALVRPQLLSGAFFRSLTALDWTRPNLSLVFVRLPRVVRTLATLPPSAPPAGPLPPPSSDRTHHPHSARSPPALRVWCLRTLSRDDTTGQRRRLPRTDDDDDFISTITNNKHNASSTAAAAFDEGCCQQLPLRLPVTHHPLLRLGDRNPLRAVRPPPHRPNK